MITIIVIAGKIVKGPMDMTHLALIKDPGDVDIHKIAVMHLTIRPGLLPRATTRPPHGATAPPRQGHRCLPARGTVRGHEKNLAVDKHIHVNSCQSSREVFHLQPHRHRSYLTGGPPGLINGPGFGDDAAPRRRRPVRACRPWPRSSQDVRNTRHGGPGGASQRHHGTRRSNTTHSPQPHLAAAHR